MISIISIISIIESFLNKKGVKTTMGRKLIKQGGGGYTIYLPKRWVDEKGLKAGDEIDIAETKGGLLLRSESTPKLKEATLNIAFKDKTFIRYIMTNFYRAGYDKVTLTGDVKENDVKTPVDDLMGLAVTSVKEKEIAMEMLAEPFKDKADKIIKKMFFIIKDDMEYVVSCIEKGEHPDEKMMSYNSRRVMQRANLCIRSMSKKLIDLDGFYWIVITHLHWIERQLYYLSVRLNEEAPAKVGADHVEYLRSVQRSFDHLYDGIYKKSLPALKKIHSEFTKYQTQKYELAASDKTYISKIMVHFSMISRFLLYTTSSAIGMATMHDMSEKE